MPGVMHSKCLFDKILSNGNNASDICIANCTWLPGNDCMFTFYNWRYVKMLFGPLSMTCYESISGSVFLLDGAEICGKYTSKKVLLKFARLQQE